MVETKLVPPDGGYGWIIVGACALYYFITIPIAQGFGLIFKDTFDDLGFSATDTSFIMNTNAAFSMFIGIIMAPLLKHLGYRKVALISAGLITVGMLLTAYARSFSHYMVTYGLVTALGSGMGMSSYSLAVNSYFIQNRTRAASYALTICGFGPVIMPQVISILLALYGVKGAVTIMGGISGHTFISALLLQPIEWHMKEEIIEDKQNIEDDKLLEEGEDNRDNSITFFNKRSAKSTLSLEENIQIDAAYNIDTPLSGSVLSLVHPTMRERSISVSSRKRTAIHQKTIQEDIEMNAFQATSSKNLNLKIDNSNTQDVNNQVSSTEKDTSQNIIERVKKKKEKSLLKRIGKHIVDIFDLTLLKDPTFVNIMVGMSFAVFSELNFSLLTPFIMSEFGLTTQEIATFMSTVSIADICFRYIAPYVSDYFKKPVRIMYLWAMGLLILSRFSLLLTRNFYGLLICAAFLGLAKGFRTVYWALVIPNYVPIERLAAASGLQSTFNSFFVWIGGPFLGIVKDLTGSFKKCILVINFLTFLTIIMWSTEFAYKRYYSRKKSEQQSYL